MHFYQGNSLRAKTIISESIPIGVLFDTNHEVGVELTIPVENWGGRLEYDRDVD